MFFDKTLLKLRITKKGEEMNHILLVYCFVGIWMLVMYLTVRLIHDYKISFFWRLCIYTLSIYFSWQGMIILDNVVMIELLGWLPVASKQEEIVELSLWIICYLLCQVMMGDMLLEREKETKEEEK